MSEATELTYGSKIEYNAALGGGGSWTEIGEVFGFAGPNQKRKEIRTDGVSDAAVTKKLGKPDAGDVSLQIGFTKTQYATILGWYQANTKKTFRITDSAAATEAFDARVMSIARKFDDDEKIMCDVTLSVTGATVFTPGA